MTTPDVFLSRSQTSALVSLSGSQIDRLERAGRFPRRVNLCERRVAWCQSELDAWMVARKQARDTSSSDE